MLVGTKVEIPSTAGFLRIAQEVNSKNIQYPDASPALRDGISRREPYSIPVVL
jgi:hypothetical protein